MLLIILDDTDEREGYMAAVKARFPEVSVQAFSKEEDIGGLIEEADILLTRKISDGLLRRAKNLQWIQVKTSGVNYIVDLPSYKKEILLTSARGIHGPQVSEMAILLMLALTSSALPPSAAFPSMESRPPGRDIRECPCAWQPRPTFSGAGT